MLLDRVQAQREEALRQFALLNMTTTPYPRHCCVHELFEEVAAKRPDAAALLLYDKTMTYGELNCRANQVAHRLIKLGVGSETLVGISMQRSFEQIVGLLAILKAGAAYVPLEPDYPGERLAFMLNDTRTPLILLQEALHECFAGQGASLLALDSEWHQIACEPTTNPTVTVDPEELAYVMYTSGSTGRPKGVTVTHRNIVRLVRETNYARLSKDEVFFQFAPVAFDASTLEIWGSLLNGAQLVICPPEHLSLQELGTLLHRYQVSTLWLAAGLFHQMVEENLEGLTTLRQLLAGGDALSSPHVRKVLAHLADCTLINGYGPTECTTFACCHSVRAMASVEASVPIGRPIANAQIVILDASLQPTPPGTSGELCIAGDGLARGYLNAPELTAERFIPHPYSTEPGARLYRTGDLVNLLPDGEIEFIGRIDNQIKLRGYRIEPGEIEMILQQHPLVRENTVLALEDTPNTKRLVAYIAPRSLEDLTAEEQQHIYSEWVEKWQTLYDETYKQNESEPEPTFDITGWKSSYTGEPLPPVEMQEWVEHTVRRILALDPKQLLEIGCGTGLLLFRLAPHCTTYYGTDFSAVVLDTLQNRCAEHQPGSVTLLQREATNFDGFEEHAFDTIVLNSIVQYFPTIDYLLEVLTGAIRVLKLNGHVFLGDVRSLPLLQAFHTSTEVQRATAGLAVEQLRQRILRQVAEEDELVIDPAFFLALRHRFPQIGHVAILPKRGQAHNELTCFRYDVVLSLQLLAESTAGHAQISQLDWQRENLSLNGLRHLLEVTQPPLLELIHIPNARLAESVLAMAALENSPATATAQEIWHEVQRQKQAYGIDPQALWNLSQEFPYTIEISWGTAYPDGGYDAFFRHHQYQELVMFPDAPITTPRPWSTYTTNPLKKMLEHTQKDQILRFLRERLPAYMLPSALVFLENLPLTPNSKVDRHALPAPHRRRPELDTTFVEPRTATEKEIAGIWQELLGIGPIGIYDDFFALGGHSLLGTQVVSRIQKRLGAALSLRLLFETPTVMALAHAAQNALLPARVRQTPPLARVSREELLPLSFAQERLWFLYQLMPTSVAYNVPFAQRLVGELAVHALAQSINTMLERHEVFRTTFMTVDSKPVQHIAPSLAFSLSLISLEALTAEEREQELQWIIHTEAHTLFDLIQGPLVRVRLVRLTPTDHVLLLTFHHSIFDAWSMRLFMLELSALYADYANGKQPSLPRPEIQYADYALWQRAWLQGEALQTQIDYWKRQLADVPILLEMPTDRPRPAIQSFRGALHVFMLPLALTREIQALAQREGVTLFMTLIAAWGVFLSRYSGQTDLAIGFPIAGRNHTQIENTIGFFVNTLLMRFQLADRPDFRQLLARVRTMATEAYAHQDVPFERLVEELQPERSLSYNPLFQVMFVLQSVPMTESKFADLLVQPLEIAQQSAQFDLTLEMVEEAAGLKGYLKYNTDLFDASTIQRMQVHLQTLLEGIVASPEKSVYELALLSAKEQEQQIFIWNDTAKDYGRKQCVHELLETQVEKTPEAPAVLFEQETWSYRELNQRANQLAHRLRKHGIGPDRLIGIYLDRSFAMVIALFGILKAGGGYVPIDPSYPQERIDYLLEDSRVELVLTQQEYAARLVTSSQVRCMVLDHELALSQQESELNPEQVVTPDHLAYVIYTSGSTGRPKGVMVTHGGLANYLRWALLAYDVEQGSGSVLHSSLAFDLSVTSLFTPLLAGQPLILLPEAQGLDALANALRQSRSLSLLKATPAHLKLLTEQLSAEEVAGRMRGLVIGGEALQWEHVAFWQAHAPQTRMFNEYGPTETVVGCCVYEVLPQKQGSGSGVPIGSPIANTQIYVLDQDLQPVPIGVRGDVYIGGTGLARGYWQRPELTAERFVPHPWSKDPGARLYQTGDVARSLPDGTLEFLGRTDAQVKLRSFRIELGEIETVLRQHESVQDATVLLRKDTTGDSYLVAYYAVGENQISEETLRQYLYNKLPSYMMPTYLLLLASLPITPNGKVDRAALPDPQQARRSSSLGHEELAATEIEATLATIWCEVLTLPRVGRHDHFFAIGGNSLKVTRVISRMRHAFGIDFPLRLLFEQPVIVGLAQVIERMQRQQPDTAARSIQALPRGGKSIEQMLASLESRPEQS